MAKPGDIGKRGSQAWDIQFTPKGVYKKGAAKPEKSKVSKEDAIKKVEAKRAEIKQVKQASKGEIERGSYLEKPVIGGTGAFIVDPKLGSNKLFSNIFLGTSLDDTVFSGLADIQISPFFESILLNPYAKEAFQPILAQFTQLKDNLNFFSSIDHDNSLTEEDKILKLEVEAIQQLNGLRKEENLFLIGGYKNAGGAHAMYYQFKKREGDTYDLYVYNAQGGSEKFQGGVEGIDKIKSLPFAFYEGITKESLNFYTDSQGRERSAKLESLFKVKVSLAAEEQPVEKVLETLAGYQKPAPKETSFFITTQRGGNCQIHSLSAVLLSLLGQELPKKKEVLSKYKSINFQMKLLALASMYQENKGMLQIQGREGDLVRQQLKIAAETLSRTALKNIDNTEIPDELRKAGLYTAQDLLNKLKTIEKRIQSVDVRAEPFSTEVFQGERQYQEKELKQVLEHINPPFRWRRDQDISKNKDYSALKSFSFYGKRDLVNGFEKLQKVSIKEEEFALQDVVECFFERISTEQTEIWSHLSEEEALEILDQCQEILLKYNKVVNMGKTQVSPRIGNTYLSLYFVMDQILKNLECEEVLKDFYLNPSELIHEDHFPRYLFENKKDLDRRNQLIAYFESRELEDKTPLFNFNKTSLEGGNGEDELEPFYRFFEDLDLDVNKYLKNNAHYFYEDFVGLEINSPDYDLDTYEKRIATFLYFLSDRTFFVNTKTNTIENYSIDNFKRVFPAKLVGFCKAQNLARLLKMNQGYRKEENLPERPLSIKFKEGKASIAASNNVLITSQEFPINPLPKSDPEHIEWLQETPLFSPESEEQLTEGEARIGNLPSSIDPFFQDIATARTNKQLNAVTFLKSCSDRIDLFEKENFRNEFWALFNDRIFDSDTGIETWPIFESMDQPGVLEILQEFINKGLERYYLTQPGLVPNYPVALFFLNFSTRFSNLFKEKTGASFSFQLNENLAKNLSNNSPLALMEFWLFKAKKDRFEEKRMIDVHICAYLLAKETEALDSEEAASLFAAWNRLVKSSFFKKNTFEDLPLVYEIQRKMENFPFDTLSEGHLNAIANTLIQKEDLRDFEPLNNWRHKEKGILEAKGKYNNIWEINPFKGVIKTPSGIIESVGELPTDEFHWPRLFSDRVHDYKFVGETLSFTDPIWGKIEIINCDIPRGIQREIDGKWYSYIDPVDLEGSLPSALISDFTHWYDPDYKKMVIDHYKTGKRTFLYKKREIKPADHSEVNIDLSWKAPTLPEYVQGFENPDFVVVEGKGNTRTRTTFSRFVSSTGKGLHLDVVETKQHEKKWQLAHNPNYYLAPLPPINPLGRCEGVLCFQHKNNPNAYKFILPGFLIKSHVKGFEKVAEWEIPPIDFTHDQLGEAPYFEIDYHGNELKGTSAESKLKLAYLFFSQKEYKTAFKWLDEITESDTLSDASKIILRDIMASGKRFRDSSANSLALRLKAFHLYKKLEPFEGEVGFFKWGDDEALIPAIYWEFLNRIKTVDSELKPSKEMELEIFEFLERDRDWIKFKKTKSGWEEEENWSLIQKRREYLLGKPVTENFYKIEDSDSEAYSFLFSEKKGEIPELLNLVDLYLKPGSVNKYILSEICRPSEDKPLGVGFKYPAKRFWIDYEFFKNPAISEEEKIAHFERLRLAKLPTKEKELVHILVMAFHLGKKMPEKPDLNQDNVKLALTKWFNKEIEPLRASYNEKRKGKAVEPFPEISKKDIKNKEMAFNKQPLSYKSRGEEAGKKVSFRWVELKNYQPEAGINRIRYQFLDEDKKGHAERKTYSRDYYKINQEDLTKDEAIYRNVIQEEGENYELEIREGKNKNKDLVSYKILSKNKLEKLQLSLRDEIGHTSSLVRHLEKIILHNMDLPIESEEARFIQLGEQAGAKRKDVRLLTVLRAVSEVNKKERLKALKAINPNLSSKDLEKIYETTLLYLEEATNLNQLQRSHGFCKKMLEIKEKDKELLPTYWEELSQNLGTLRSYTPSQNPQALVFEFLSGLRVRKEQADIIQKSLLKVFRQDPEKNDFGMVFQLIMGGGKTSVILSQLTNLAARKGQIPLFLCHHSQYSSVLGNLKEFQKSRFGQEVISLDFNRQDPSGKDLSNIEVLRHIRDKFRQAKSGGKAIIMKTTLLQTMNLELKSLCKALSEETDRGKRLNISERASLLGEVLTLVKEDAIGLFDEIDLNLNILQGVHFPIGAKNYLKPSRVGLVKEIYRNLATDPKLKTLIKLDENKQNELSEKDYRTKVIPILAEKLSQYRGLHIDDAYKRGFIDYLEGKIPLEVERDAKNPNVKIDLNNHQLLFMRYLHKELHFSTNPEKVEAAHLITLSKYLVENIVPTALKKNHNRHYGRRDSKVVPFVAVGVAATTEYANIYEKAAMHFQEACCTKKGGGVALDQVKQLAKESTERASFYANQHKILFEETQDARLFKNLTGIPLHKIWDKGKLERARNKINENIEMILNFEEKSAEFNLDYTPRTLSSTPISVVGQVKQAIGCSGTIWNKDTYHRDLKNNVEVEPGTEGRILDHLENEVLKKKSKILTVKENSVEAILQSSFDARKNSANRIKGLIDVGGLFKDYDNLTVAKKVIEFFDQEKIKNQVDEIEGVVFTYKDPVTKEESFSMLKKQKEGGKISYDLVHLDNSSYDEVAKQGIHEKNLFFFYDELRATGTDFKQLPDAVNLVTFDPKTTTMRSYLQAILRMRGFFIGQNADIVLPENVLKYLPGLKKGEKTTPQLLGKAAIRNQAVEKGKQLFRSYKEQIYESFAVEVENQLLKLVAQELNKDYTSLNEEDLGELESRGYEGVEKFMKAYDAFIFAKFEDNPYLQFGSLDYFEKPRKVLEDYYKHQLTLFKECLEQRPLPNSDKILEQIETSVNSILDASDKLNFKVRSKASGENEEASIEINYETVQETFVELELDIEEELRVERNGYLEGVGFKDVWKEKNWNLSGTTFKEASGVTTRPIVEVLAEPFSVGASEINYKHPYHTLFPDNLHMTENFMHSFPERVGVFHPAQKHANQVLAVKNESDMFDFYLLSMEEAVKFKEWIEAVQPNDAFLMSSNGVPLTRGGHPFSNDFMSQEALQKGLWAVNLFQANTEYLSNAEELTKEKFSEDEDNFELTRRYLQIKSFDNKYHFQIFKTNDLFQKEEEEVVKISKEDAEGMFSKEEKKAIYRLNNKKEIQKLSGAEFYFIHPKNFHLLDKKQWKSMPPGVIKNVPNKDLKNVPDKLVPYIESKKQILYLAKHCESKLALLGTNPETAEQQVNALGKANLKYLRADATPYLENHYIKYLNAYQVKALPPSKVKFVSPEVVSGLPQASLIYLETPEQFKNLSIEQIKDLKHPNVLVQIDPEKAKYLSKEQWELMATAEIEVDKKNLRKIVDQLYLNYKDSGCNIPKEKQTIDFKGYIALTNPSQMFLVDSKEKLETIRNEDFSKFDRNSMAILEEYEVDSEEIPYLSPSILDVIPKGFGYLITSEQIQGLTKDNKEAIQSLDPFYFGDSDSKVRQDQVYDLLSDECFEHLSDKMIHKASLDVLRNRLPAGKASSLDWKQVQNLKPEDENWDQSVISNLSSEQVKQLSDEYKHFVPFLSYQQTALVNFNRMHPNQWDKKNIRFLTKNQAYLLNRLDVKHLNLLQPRALKGLDAKHIKMITNEKLLLKIPNKKFEHLKNSQLKVIFSKSPKSAMKLSKKQWLTLTPDVLDLSKIKSDKHRKAILKKMPEECVHLLSLQEIKKKYLGTLGKTFTQIGWGILGTIVMVPRLIGELLFYNLPLLIVKSFLYLFRREDQALKELKGQAHRSFILSPILAGLQALRIFSPARYLKYASKFSSQNKVYFEK